MRRSLVLGWPLHLLLLSLLVCAIACQLHSPIVTVAASAVTGAETSIEFGGDIGVRRWRANRFEDRNGRKDDRVPDGPNRGDYGHATDESLFANLDASVQTAWPISLGEHSIGTFTLVVSRDEFKLQLHKPAQELDAILIDKSLRDVPPEVLGGELRESVEKVLQHYGVDLDDIRLKRVVIEGPEYSAGVGLGKNGAGAQAFAQFDALLFEVETATGLIDLKLRAGIGLGYSVGSVLTKKGDKLGTKVAFETSVGAWNVKYSNKLTGKTEKLPAVATADLKAKAAIEKIENINKGKKGKKTAPASASASASTSPPPSGATPPAESAVETAEETDLLLRAWADDLVSQFPDDGHVALAHEEWLATPDKSKSLEPFLLKVARRKRDNEDWAKFDKFVDTGSLFLERFGVLTKSPAMRTGARAIQGTLQTFRGVRELHSAMSLVAAKGLVAGATKLLSSANVFMAGVSILSSLFGDSESDAMGEMLEQIQQTIVQGFEQTWKMLDAMHEDIVQIRKDVHLLHSDMHKRFDVVMEAMRWSHESLAMRMDNLAAKSEQLIVDVRQLALFIHDHDMKVAVDNLLQRDRTEWCTSAVLSPITATIGQWLLGVPVQPQHSGVLKKLPAGHVQLTADEWESKDIRQKLQDAIDAEDPANVPAGLFGSLATRLDAQLKQAYGARVQSLINSRDFVAVWKTYHMLLSTCSDTIMQLDASAQATYRGKIEAIRGLADLFTSFLSSVSNSTALWANLAERVEGSFEVFEHAVQRKQLELAGGLWPNSSDDAVSPLIFSASEYLAHLRKFSGQPAHPIFINLQRAVDWGAHEAKQIFEQSALREPERYKFGRLHWNCGTKTHWKGSHEYEVTLSQQQLPPFRVTASMLQSPLVAEQTAAASRHFSLAVGSWFGVLRPSWQFAVIKMYEAVGDTGCSCFGGCNTKWNYHTDFSLVLLPGFETTSSPPHFTPCAQVNLFRPSHSVTSTSGTQFNATKPEQKGMSAGSDTPNEKSTPWPSFVVARAECAAIDITAALETQLIKHRKAAAEAFTPAMQLSQQLAMTMLQGFAHAIDPEFMSIGHPAQPVQPCTQQMNALRESGSAGSLRSLVHMRANAAVWQQAVQHYLPNLPVSEITFDALLRQLQAALHRPNSTFSSMRQISEDAAELLEQLNQESIDRTCKANAQSTLGTLRTQHQTLLDELVSSDALLFMVRQLRTNGEADSTEIETEKQRATLEAQLTEAVFSDHFAGLRTLQPELHLIEGMFAALAVTAADDVVPPPALGSAICQAWQADRKSANVPGNASDQIFSLCCDPHTEPASLLAHLNELEQRLTSVEGADAIMNPPAPRLSPLLAAVSMGRAPIVRLLLEFGAVVTVSVMEQFRARYSRYTTSTEIQAMLEFYQYVQSLSLNELSVGRVLRLTTRSIDALRECARWRAESASVVFTIGETGRGKGSLCNDLLGLDYVVSMCGLKPCLRVSPTSPVQREVFPTSSLSRSNTSVPQVEPLPAGTFGAATFLSDFMGYGDTRGKAYEAANAIGLRLASACFVGIKQILVMCDHNDFSQARQKELRDLLAFVGKITRGASAGPDQWRRTLAHVTLVVNRFAQSPAHLPPLDATHFKNELTTFVDTVPDLEEHAAFVMTHLTAQQIVLTAFPDKQLRQHLQTVIKTAEAAPTDQFNFRSFHPALDEFQKLIKRQQAYKVAQEAESSTISTRMGQHALATAEQQVARLDQLRQSLRSAPIGQVATCSPHYRQADQRYRKLLAVHSAVHAGLQKLMTSLVDRLGNLTAPVCTVPAGSPPAFSLPTDLASLSHRRAAIRVVGEILDKMQPVVQYFQSDATMDQPKEPAGATHNQPRWKDEL